jgi:hypothetical protein
MPRDKKKPDLPRKPDGKSHPDPLKRFKALKEWRKAVDKILGHEKVMEWKPKITIEAGTKEFEKKEESKMAIQKETEAIKKEIGEVKEEKKKLTSAEQLAELKRIRKNNKRLRDKKAQEEKEKAKKKKN